MRAITLLIGFLIHFSVVVQPASHQNQLKDGFYIADEQGETKAVYKGKVYHLRTTPVCLISQIDTSTVTPAIYKEGAYDLDIVLDEKGSLGLNKATDIFANKTRYIALVLNHQPVKMMRVMSRIRSGHIALSGTSKAELVKIQSQFKLAR